MEFNNFVSLALDKGYSTAAIFVDFTKAFDCVDHKILLHKLAHQFCFSDNANNLIRSYLTNRTQTVRVCDSSSLRLWIDYGVPQGSILGPLLFILFINDLHTYLSKSFLLLYADDATLLFSQNDCHSLIATINSELKTL